MKKKIVFIILGIVVLVLIVLAIISCFKFTFNDELLTVKDMITEQSEKEKKFNSKGYTLDKPQVILNPYGNSPLTALVIFETLEEEEVEVTIVGKDELSSYTNTFSKTKKHYLPIYGLYADYNNKVIIKCGNETKEINIKTEALPEDFILPEDIFADKDKLTNDLYFYTPSSSGYTCAYDVNGDVRWYLTNYALWKIDRLKNGHLLVSTERLVNSPYYMTGLYEMDLLGKIYTEFSLPGGYHHDYYEMENGDLLVASDDFNNSSGTVEDYLVLLDRESGMIVKSFDLKNILNMEDGKSENWTSYDWFHNNSVWYDKKTNSITLSGRHQDAVINIDYDTGDLNWIIGDPTNWSEEYQKYFFTPIGDDFEWQWSQHAAMITPEGYVFILDNGNNKSKKESEYVKAIDSYTRGVMYEINTDDMTIKQVWEYGKERGSSFYSPYISDVDYLAKNHYIVHSGGISYKDGKILNVPAGIGEADTLRSITTELLEDEVIFELVLPTNNYRVEKMSLYTDNDRNGLILGKGKEVGSLGKTKADSKKLWLYKNTNEIDSTYKKYEISITKEKDRLVFKGRFKKSDNVKVILYKNMIATYYDVPISKKPYTALCVDVFTEEETENGIVVTKYINKDSLYDNFSIYVEINGVVYKTLKYVNFYEG